MEEKNSKELLEEKNKQNNIKDDSLETENL